MEWFEYLIIALAFTFVALVTYFGIRHKIKHKCSGNCTECNHMCECSSKKLLEEYHKMNQQ